MKIVLFANTDWYLYNFRLPLIKSLISQGNQVVVIAPEGYYSKKIENEGIKVVCLRFKRTQTNIFNELGLVLELVRIFFKIKPDLIHVFTLRVVFHAAVAALLTRSKLIASITGLGSSFISKKPLSLLIRFISMILFSILFSSKNRKIITQNKDDCKIILKYTIVPKSNIAIIRGSGVDRKFFKAKLCQELNPTSYKILMVSRILKDKGVIDFVKSSSYFVGQKNISFFHVGGFDYGNPESLTKELLDKFKKYSNVTFIGHRDNVQNIMLESTVLVLPSLREGFPKTIMEAMSCKLPVITYDSTGCRDSVLHGKNGFIIPKSRPDLIAKYLKIILRNTEIRKRMSKSAYFYSKNNYRADLIDKLTINLYKKMIADVKS